MERHERSRVSLGANPVLTRRCALELRKLPEQHFEGVAELFVHAQHGRGLVAGVHHAAFAARVVAVAVAVPLTAAFLLIDLAYFASNLFKIPEGGWFPILIAAVIFTAMTTWKKGRQLLGSRLRAGSLSLERFIASVHQRDIVRVPGTAVYMFSRPGATPPALLANMRHNEVLHERVAVLSVLTTAEPRVPVSRRADVWSLGDGFFQIVLRYGFMERPNVPEGLMSIIRSDFGFDPEDTVWILGRETVLASDLPGMLLWREKLFSLMARNATPPSRYFRLPPERSLEIGIQIEI